MKKIKISITILFIFLIFLLIGISYYVLGDIESKVPKEISKTSKIEEYEFMNRKIFIIKPINKIENEKVILYFHGGSYMAGATLSHWEFLSNLANDTSSTIIMPDYPLGPKHNYEDVYKMVEPFYNKLIERVSTKDLVIMGDSAGGGLALALEEKIGKENVSMPSKTILISPWLDVRLENPKIKEYENKDKILNKETLKLAGIAYSKEDLDNNYLVNPIDGDLSKLENVVILIGTNDILNPDVKLLKEKAQMQGVRRRHTNKRI